MEHRLRRGHGRRRRGLRPPRPTGRVLLGLRLHRRADRPHPAAGVAGPCRRPEHGPHPLRRTRRVPRR
ncbi:hypothetical protein SGPA1_20741 [Streptomyces misionensis JCM 4497]